MELFPKVVIRAGGGSFENLELLNIEPSADLENHCRLKEELKNEISDLLFNLISKIEDSKRQNNLLNIRRNVFNEKILDNKKELVINEIADELTKLKIKDYYTEIEEIEKCLDKIKGNYEKTLPELRRNLKILSKEKCIKNGFVFSSHSLYKNVEELNPDSKEYTKNTKKNEMSLIKYMTRTFAKTSPFSSFNNLAVAEFKNGESEDFLWKEDESELKIKSNIRLNNNLFLYIKNCMFRLEELYSYFYVKLNPTITLKNDQYKYLINFSNIESFQKLQASPIIEYLLSLVKEKTNIRFCELTDKIVKDELLEASKEDIEVYIFRLIEIGFFEFDLGISGLDTDWLVKLVDFLLNIPVETETKAIIIDTLKYLYEKVPLMQEADTKTRLEISNESFEKFSAMKQYLDGLLKPAEVPAPEKNPDDKGSKDSKNESDNVNEESDNKNEPDEDKIVKNVQYFYYDLKPESLFYEDTVIENSFLIEDAAMKELMNDITQLLNYFRIFEGRFTEQAVLREFFKNTYGEDAKVDLLTFYEDYITVKKEEMKKKERLEKEKKENKEKTIEENGLKENSTDNSDGGFYSNKENKARIDLQKKFLDGLAEKINKANIPGMAISLNKDFFINELEGNNIDYLDEEFTSLGYFLMFFHDSDSKNKIKVVLNASFPGYGKMISRFLHLFSDDITEEIRKWNNKYSSGTIVAENIDSGIMNFNLHPALMPYEISIPGGNYVLEEEKRIPVSRMQVYYDSKDNSLNLVDKENNKNVYIFDLGFQGTGGRSELFKFLENFTLSKMYFINSLISKIQETIKPEKKYYNGISDDIKYSPRIMYNDRIVLSRKSWMISNKLLPHKLQAESESSYFSRIQRWRIEMGLPNEVFMYLSAHGYSNDSKTKPKKKVSRDDYKPQYINFNNPFLVRLFEKSLDKIVDKLKLGEMLPGSEQLLRINGKKYVTEFVVNSYNYTES